MKKTILTEEQEKLIFDTPYRTAEELSEIIGIPASTIKNIRHRAGVYTKKVFMPDPVEFIQVCQELKRQQRVAEYYNVCHGTIHCYCKKIGYTFTEIKKVNAQQIKEIENAYYLKSSTELAKQYNVSVSRVAQIWTNAGLKGKENRTYYLNHNCLKTINKDTAYFLGFLGADGCIHHHTDGRQDVISFQIQKQDKKILERFNELLETNKPLYTISNRYIALQISSNIISSDLNKLGLSYRKTYKNTIANIDDKYMLHLIRGYMDGDGSLRPNDNKEEEANKTVSDIVINFVGYYSNLKKIQIFLERIGIISELTKDKRKYTEAEDGGSFYTLHITNRMSKYAFVKEVYKDCGDFYLERKKHNADRFIRFVENSTRPIDKQITLYYQKVVKGLSDVIRGDNKMDIQIMKLSNTAKTPMRGSEDAAGWDLYADISEDIIIKPHSSQAIPTNIAIAIPKGYFGGIYARSGLAFKNGIRPCNCTGVVDADFRNGIMVGLHNDSDKDFVVSNGMRIAQLIIHKFEDISFSDVQSLDATERGLNGFGSTGLH